MSVLYVARRDADSAPNRRRAAARFFVLLGFYKGCLHAGKVAQGGHDILGGEIEVMVKAKDRTAAAVEAFEALRQAGVTNRVDPVWVLVTVEDARWVSRDWVADVLKKGEAGARLAFGSHGEYQQYPLPQGGTVPLINYY